MVNWRHLPTGTYSLKLIAGTLEGIQKLFIEKCLDTGMHVLYTVLSYRYKGEGDMYLDVYFNVLNDDVISARDEAQGGLNYLFASEKLDSTMPPL